MNQRKLVAISQRVNLHETRGEILDALDQRLIGFLMAAEYFALPVPNGMSNAIFQWLQALAPDAIVLSGGGNIGEYPERDATEIALLDYGTRHDLPILGLCRGMQVMAHTVGTGLKRVTGHVGVQHSVTGKINEIVNSYHDFALIGCPAGFEVTAQSQDGVIEAIRHLKKPWEGWMWHPERSSNFHPSDLNRLKELFK